MVWSSPCAAARAKTSSGDRPPDTDTDTATLSAGRAGEYAAVTAALAAQAAARLGAHSSRGSAGRVRSTALGAVAA